jgi:hypothetical protein
LACLRERTSNAGSWLYAELFPGGDFGAWCASAGVAWQGRNLAHELHESAPRLVGQLPSYLLHKRYAQPDTFAERLPHPRAG